MSGSKLKLHIYGDECLRKKSVPVKEVGVAERMLIKAMVETMHEHQGIGLAAPQVGIEKRLFVVDIGDGPFAVINPKVLKKNGSGYLEEGCLSLPGISVNVKRPNKIAVQYTDENNQTVKKELSQLMARVFLHELDHLDGKMIIDYAGLREKLKLRKPLKAMQSQNKAIL